MMIDSFPAISQLVSMCVVPLCSIFSDPSALVTVLQPTPAANAIKHPVGIRGSRLECHSIAGLLSAVSNNLCIQSSPGCPPNSAGARLTTHPCSEEVNLWLFVLVLS